MTFPAKFNICFHFYLQSNHSHILLQGPDRLHLQVIKSVVADGNVGGAQEIGSVISSTPHWMVLQVRSQRLVVVDSMPTIEFKYVCGYVYMCALCVHLCALCVYFIVYSLYVYAVCVMLAVFVCLHAHRFRRVI